MSTKIYYMIAVLVIACVWAQADLIKILPTADARIGDNSPQDGIGNSVSQTTNAVSTVGDLANNILNRVCFVMALPTLSSGQVLDTASMDVFLSTISGNPVRNVQADLFFKNTGAVEVSDYSTAASASLQNFITPSSTVATHYAWTGGDLLNALQTVYAGGTAPASSYAVVRLQWQGTISGDGNGTLDVYNFATSEAVASAQRPAMTLTTTTVPEPATAGLFIISGFICLLLRRISR